LKIAIIEINGAFPDTELSKPATVTIEGRSYTGTVRIVVLGEDVVATTKVVLEGSGLKAVPT